MKKPGLVFVVFACAVILIFQSCRKGDSTNISQAGGTRSHNMGKNCMNCHYSGGRGDGWFNAAGTVYNSSDSTSTYTNPVVQLYTAPDSLGNQTLVATINGDAKGNFYTTATINFGTGLYPVVTGTHTRYMAATITEGACNGCHGVTTAKLNIN